MKIKKTHIENQPFFFQFQIPKISPENFSMELEKEISLFCQGSIEKRSQDQFLVKGNYSSCFEVYCQCCLVYFLYNTKEYFQILLLPKSIFENQSTDSSDVAVDSYIGEDIFLDSYFETQFLLDIPFTVKCKEDCKGICVNCGVNLNKNLCNCLQSMEHNTFAEYFQRKKK